MKPEKYWFVSKKYGWGWTPVRWQGWLVTLVFVLVLFATAWIFGSMDLLDWERTVLMLLAVMGHSLVMIAVCLKTGEPPKWRWGEN